MKLETQIENIKIDASAAFPNPKHMVSIRISVVGFCEEAQANQIVEHWREKKACEIEEMFHDLGYTVTLNFKGIKP